MHNQNKVIDKYFDAMGKRARRGLNMENKIELLNGVNSLPKLPLPIKKNGVGKLSKFKYPRHLK